MFGLEFKNPYFLLFLIPYVIFIVLYFVFKVGKRETSIPLSSSKIVKRTKSFKTITYPFLPILRMLSILFLIIALARPGIGVDYTSVKNKGIDIMIVLDVSTSMLGEDFQPKNRLHVAKDVISGFAAGRKTDRLGLVIFAGQPYLQCPLTLEHEMLQEIISQVDFNSVDIDGTAIGDSIMLAVSRMKESEAKSKIILLVTDGVNNRGNVDPETAASIAAEYGVKIYAVGIGKNGAVPYPTGNSIINKKQYVENQFDEEGIKKIASISGGKFYRAESSGVFWDNINDIDRLEKTEYNVKVYYEFYDRFYIFLIISASLFFTEILLRTMVYRKVP